MDKARDTLAVQVLVNEDNLLEEDRINAAYILRECVQGE